MKPHLVSARKQTFTSSCAKAAALLSVATIVPWTAVASAQTIRPNTTVTPFIPSQVSDAQRHRRLVQAKDVLRNNIEVAKSRCRQAQKALQDAMQRRDELTATQNAMRSEINKHDLSVEGALPILQSLEKDKIATEIQRCAIDSRVRALRKAIDRLSAESQIVLKEDKVKQRLERIVAHHQQKLDQIRSINKQAPGSVSEMQIGDAEVELAEAELRVLLREEELSKGDSAETLAAFNRQLVELTVDLAEYDARRKFIAERVREIRPLMELIEEYRRLERRVSTESVDALRTKVLESEQFLFESEQAYLETSRQLKELEAASQEHISREMEKLKAADKSGEEGMKKP